MLPGTDAAECRVEAAAAGYWPLEDSLPVGQRMAVDAARDLRQGKRFADLSLDDVLTDLGPAAGDLRRLGAVRQGDFELTLSASPAFRELVAFTPAHRQAVCLEPYTCTTDAINLQERGIDAGLLVLRPGEEWTATVRIACKVKEREA